LNVDISIVVPSRGRGPKLRRLLELLAGQVSGPGTDFEVLIGLDGEPPGAVDVAPDDYDYEVRLIPLPRVGISAAKNACCAEARGRIVLFVNDDIEPEPGFIRAHAEAHAGGEAIVLGSAPWKRYDDQTVFDEAIARTGMIFFYDRLESGGRYDFRHAWNLNLSVDREVLAGLEGPFASGLRPYMFEDVEAGYRLMGCATNIYYQPAAMVTHNHRYTLPRYLEREAMLGVMAPQLAKINPHCFAAIFGGDPGMLAASAHQALGQDVRDGQRTLERLLRVANRPAPVQDIDVETFYLAHLPLKRRAFRAGLLSALDRPEIPWHAREALASEALATDDVFEGLAREREGRLATAASVSQPLVKSAAPVVESIQGKFR